MAGVILTSRAPVIYGPPPLESYSTDAIESRPALNLPCAGRCRSLRFQLEDTYLVACIQVHKDAVRLGVHREGMHVLLCSDVIDHLIGIQINDFNVTRLVTHESPTLGNIDGGLIDGAGNRDSRYQFPGCRIDNQHLLVVRSENQVVSLAVVDSALCSALDPEVPYSENLIRVGIDHIDIAAHRLIQAVERTDIKRYVRAILGVFGFELEYLRELEGRFALEYSLVVAVIVSHKNLAGMGIDVDTVRGFAAGIEASHLLERSLVHDHQLARRGVGDESVTVVDVDAVSGIHARYRFLDGERIRIDNHNVVIGGLREPDGFGLRVIGNPVAVTARCARQVDRFDQLIVRRLGVCYGRKYTGDCADSGQSLKFER